MWVRLYQSRFLIWTGNFILYHADAIGLAEVATARVPAPIHPMFLGFRSKHNRLKSELTNGCVM
jgi:hypothetical protein